MQAVLAAVNHNVPAADLLLREMEQHQAPSGSDSDEDLANLAVPPQNLASQPGNQSQTLSDQSSGLAASPQTLKAPAPPSSRVPTRTLSSRRRKQSSEEEDADVDLYYQHRGEALKLSRRWHKKLHQAANAFAAAQFSGDCSAVYWLHGVALGPHEYAKAILPEHEMSMCLPHSQPVLLAHTLHDYHRALTTWPWHTRARWLSAGMGRALAFVGGVWTRRGRGKGGGLTSRCYAP